MDIIVRRGDSLWYFSQLFHLDLQLILDSNRGIDPDKISVGQRIRIPGFVVQDYQVQQGDSLWAIARNRNLGVDALLLVNQHINPNQLEIGQMIKVPIRITWRLVQGKQNYDFSRTMKDIGRLQSVYPFMEVNAIGKSVLGNELSELRMGKGSKRIHYNASFHANEWITTAVLMTFLNDYLLSLTNQNPIRGLEMSRLYQQTSLSVVPMVNPDGVNLVLHGPPENPEWKNRVVEFNKGSTDFTGWKANIRGIDLNDQFPARWELERARNPKVPGPRDYGGEKLLSEPEAIAMADLTRERDYARVFAFHTQGEEIYWGFENMEPPKSEGMVNELSRVSGYKPVKILESYAGYKDWFIQDWQRPGFTVELGHGVNPLPLSQFDEIYQKALGIFLAGLYL
ncbi:M14 family metallopeptidase [Neobacillus rhizophilus]|uniref:LysM peptidoglycan-binding domain-containing protein n=1 Tax=Neobacillus rhizophilus TaxID=2833579 RepID=A0A942U7Z2_9BACI|nr:M14 family metallopeptidase [Neobacillus rhizophilus]MBS4216430.1 LysM peptidoglycan-binding domain-containing protein [Neobacillus rhizophilus]